MMNNESKKLYAAVEAGGTKFVCAIGTSPTDIIASATIPTTNPQDTLKNTADWFSVQSQRLGPLTALGVGCFGPVDVDPASSSYGEINGTPKKGWSGTDIVRDLSQLLSVPIALDTDVHCALLGEALFGAGQGLKDLVYLTIGTGIGGGILSNGEIVYGTNHPEMGHILLPKQPDDTFEGACPYHKDACAEGLASGPAIYQRWGAYSHELEPDHPAWDLEARYVANLCYNIMQMMAPQKIILGGGVMQQQQLFPIIRQKLHNYANGYGTITHSCVDLEKIIVPPILSGNAGVAGAIHIASQHASTGRDKMRARSQ